MNYFYKDPYLDEEEEEEKKEESSSNDSSLEDTLEDLQEKREQYQKNENPSQSNNGNTPQNNTPQGNGGNAPQGNAGGEMAQNAGKEASKKAAEETGKKVAEETGKKVAEEGAKQAATQTAATTSTAAASGAAASGTGAAVASGAGQAVAASGPYGWIVVAIIIIVIVICIILTGIFMFLATMPGMVMDALKDLFKTAGNFLAAFFGADTTQMIDNSRIYETLDYLDDMGWDLKGDGFLTNYIENESDLNAMDSELKEGAGLDDGDYYIDDLQGVVRGSQASSGANAGNQDKIILAESDFIFTYIMSDNYIYTIKNENMVTQRDNFDGFLGFLENVFTGVNTFFYKLYNVVYGPIFDFMGLTNANMEIYGKGMLAFYFQNDLGDRGTPVNFGSWQDDVGSIEVDAEQGLLTIKRSHILNGNKPIQYSLDGWTGRYGMPLEFLLSVHKATLKPDLAYDMATSFNTNVNILLKDLQGEVMAGYKTNGKIITYDQVTRVTDSFSNVLLIGPLLNWFDRLGTSEKEAIAMYELGLDIIDNIKCPDCKTDILPMVFRKDLNGDGQITSDEIPADEGEILKKKGDDYYYTLDDNDYTGSIWEIFAGVVGVETDDTDTKGDGEYYAFDTDANDEISEEEEKNMDSHKYKGNEAFIENVTVPTKLCKSCMTKAETVANLLNGNTDYNFKAYQPYIESVTDHWYRDVYFIRPKDIQNNGNLTTSQKQKYQDANIVIQDYDYESVMKERWTLYKTYEATDELAGNFIWYIIDKDGNYAKTKSAVTDSISEDAEEEIDESKLKTDSDGFYYYYVADIDDARKVGLAVSKKAETVDANDTDALEDLGWKKTGSVWSAYEVNDKEMQTGYESLGSFYNSVEEFEAAYNNDNKKEYAKYIYINMKTNGNIIQVGEGVRGETNAEIKKMFLQNKYFQYDGSTETAEIITALRNEIYQRRLDSNWFDINNLQPKYGPLTEDEFKSEITLDVDGDGTSETYRVKDYAATVTLEQDALNAFTMLENTHTLDADYIYRDFKELVVELGYYTKEELTEGVPRIISFLIPEIGSAGFPERTIDKIEEEFGTMVHSKYDIEANRKYTIKEVIGQKIGDMHEEAEGQQLSSVNLNNDNTLLASASRTEKVLGVTSRVNNDRLSLNANPINTTEVGIIEIAPKKPQQVSIDTFLKKTREMCEYMNMVGYDYCVYSSPHEGQDAGSCTCPPECTELYKVYGICYKQTDRVPSSKKATGVSCPCPVNHCKHDVHRNDAKRPGHHLARTFEESKELHANNVCCDRLVKWALQNVGVISADGGAGGAGNLGQYCLNTLKGKKINKGEDLEPGDILCSSSHIEIVGEKKKSGFVQYNGGHQIDVGAVEGGPKSAIGLASQAASWGWAEYAIRLPWAKSEVGVYEGYEGNEAVVSPVTGILLEYDTLTRTNIDQKYKSAYEDQVNEEKGIETNDPAQQVEQPVSAIVPDDATDEGGKTEAITGKIVEEEVGYARILVLNEEYYTALEKKFLEKDSSLKVKESDGSKYVIKTQDELDNMLKKPNGFMNETLLAYRNMKDDYEYAGIAGYIVTVEGFKPQLPDPDFDSNDDDHFDDEEKLPFEGKDTSKYDLTLDDFRVSLDNIKKPGDKIQTGYEIPEEYKVASEDANEKLLVKEVMKVDAAYAMEVAYGDKPAIFIKEGTILGRTYTDREVILSLRNEKLEDYMSEETLKGEAPDPEKGNMDKIIGNYVRTIMENGTDDDRDKTYVEDVEDYMKLDEIKQSKPNDWELFFWLPFESGACDDTENGGPECIGVCSEGETAVGIIQWTALGDMNNIAPFFQKCIDMDSALCAPLAAFTGWSVNDFKNDIGTPGNIKYTTSQVKAALSQICDTDRETFLTIQMDIAKEEYLDPLLSEYPWLENRPSCVQGAVMHLRVWGASTGWLGTYESASDEDIIKKVRHTIANTSSTAGEATGNENAGRAYNEPQIALEILSGGVTKEDVEKWVREKDPSIFSFKFR